MSISSIIPNQGNEYFRQACDGKNLEPSEIKGVICPGISAVLSSKERAENQDDECSAGEEHRQSRSGGYRGCFDPKDGRISTNSTTISTRQSKDCGSAYNRSEDLKSVQWRRRMDRATADLQLKLGSLYFHDGATKLQNGDYKTCLSRMRDCYRPIEEVKRLARITGDELDDLLSESETLEQDVFYHSCSASSMQARHHGDHLLTVALQEEEELDMTLVFEVIDWYKQAVVLAREVEIEQEAIAESRLGVVYDKVLKLTQRAKTYFNHTLQLVESMKPRVFTSQDWYKECITALQRYQEEVRQRDEEEKRKVTAKYLEELKEEIEDITKNNTSAIALIKHVYNTYPPKSTTWEKPSDDDMAKWESLQSGTKEYKKVLVKALAVFHPDKVDEKEHGMKWKVLSEEITKMITNYYEHTKFAC
ncbi:hypothetical protein OS493_019775 [Desmophyllum pertusum]|uniref:J domain-containing protein n=1 Tax=Desmophyllum pertusum TaxID=174260 RepID=A0A9X0CQW1_9CNID|nr:hypothetical protein OS493_019775 [Desmophyllum pertusum]